jgi:hypothetical protein
MNGGREQDGSDHSKDCASQVHVCWTRSREIRYRLYHRLSGLYRSVNPDRPRSAGNS